MGLRVSYRHVNAWFCGLILQEPTALARINLHALSTAGFCFRLFVLGFVLFLPLLCLSFKPLFSRSESLSRICSPAETPSLHVTLVLPQSLLPSQHLR